jgi:hypothetical protein
VGTKPNLRNGGVNHTFRKWIVLIGREILLQVGFDWFRRGKKRSGDKLGLRALIKWCGVGTVRFSAH